MVVIAWVVTPPLAILLAVDLGFGAVGGWLALLAEWATGAAVLWNRVARRGWRQSAVRARERLEATNTVLVIEPAPNSA